MTDTVKDFLECIELKPTPSRILLVTPLVADSIDMLLAVYGIDSPLARAHFYAQIAHESDGFNTLEEYASGKAYEGRKDLGNTQKGDGVKYKGRGYIQLTGRYNYKTYGDLVGEDLINNPRLASDDPYVALKIAAQYWQKHDLTKYAKLDNIETITKRINGGFNGLADRKRFLKLFKEWENIS
jgi:putative chitinase